MDQLERLAKGLLEYETLSGDEVRAIANGEAIHREESDDEAPKSAGRRASVPTTGGGPGKEPPGMAPEPQPGT
jgi:cell division protease FtsH